MSPTQAAEFLTAASIVIGLILVGITAAIVYKLYGYWKGKK